MKKFEQKAIPLIFRNEQKKYEVNPEAIRFFQSIEGKIAVISVAGVYRTGKSYLLNTILLKQKAGFAVGPTTNPKTKGIWVWGKPLILKNEKDEIINVCVLDSEGLGSIEEDVNHDLRLFSLTLLLSSMFIYNTLGSIDENAIDSLGLVLRLCQRLRAESYNDFPDFYWVLRDFSLALVGRDNKPLSANKYLEQSLSPQAGDSDIRNKIRQSIRSSFVNRSCFTFVRPLTKEEQLQKLDTLQIDQLRPQFMEQVIEFRRLINSSIKTKKIKGKEVTPGMLVELIKVYTAEINGQQLPQIETGWKYVCARECEQAINIVENEAEEAVSKLLSVLPSSKKELAEKKDALYEYLKKTFQAKTKGNDQAAHFQPQIQKMLDKMMGRVQDEMKTKNGQQTKAFIKKEFESVQRRLKGGEIKSMGELAKQFEMFYEYYKKKCPYKDQIQTGLQTIMKKFSDCSLVLFKNVKNRKDQESAKLREEVERLTQELHSKQEKHKHEKNIAADKLAILESKLQEISKLNRQLNDELTQSQMALQKLRQQKEEGDDLASETADMEMLVLRKKLMDAQQAVQEAECTKQFEINNFKNQVFLRENEINHLTEQRDSLMDKIDALSNELNYEKEERGRRIQELISTSESSRNEWEAVRKSFEERIASRQQQILRLESALEAKAAELITLTQQHDKTLKALLERHESEKTQLQEYNKAQIKALKEALEVEQEENLFKLKKMEADYSQKEMDNKMQKLEIDRQMAILNQQLEFVRKECLQKEQKISKLQDQNSCYLSMLEEKDNQLLSMNSCLDESRISKDTYESEATVKLQKVQETLKIKMNQIARLQANEDSIQDALRVKQQEIKQLEEKYKNQAKSYEQKIKELNDRLLSSQKEADKNVKSLQQEIQALKLQNTKGLDQQKRNAEISLVQLKNYYEMERQRLEKRNLQERKKHENLESILSADFEGKHRKAIRALQEQLQSMRNAKDQLEQTCARMQNQYELRLNGNEEERENEKRLLINRYQILEKKYDDLQKQFDQLEQTSDEERINLVKKIESLNHDISRKEKDLMQLNSKKESLEQSIAKRQNQTQSFKKMMQQEVDSALKKVADTGSKYQKLNEEYMKYRIQTEKELALIKQKNEFQASKLNELSKDKDSGSTKNFDKLDKQRYGDLKEQNDKLKADILNLEGKLEAQKKALRDQEAAAKKQYATLERDYECLVQKQSFCQAKLEDLEAKVSHKNQMLDKKVDETRAKANDERLAAQKQVKELQEKITVLEAANGQLLWNQQKESLLTADKIKYVEYQRDQAKKELQECEKRLAQATAQLRKASEKSAQDNESRKLQSDKKFTGQIESLKQSLNSKTQQYQEFIRKLKDQLRSAKEKISTQNSKLQTMEREKTAERNYQEENQMLKNQKIALAQAMKAEKQKQGEEFKKRLNELQRKNKQLDKYQIEQRFHWQKESSKWAMQKEALADKIKNLEEALQYERNRIQTAKSKSELKKSQSSSNFNFTEYSRFSSGWK